MKLRRLVAALVAAASALVLLAGAAAAPVGLTDATGDANGAPDIAGVAVTNGQTDYVWAITLPNRQELGDADFVFLAIDSDRNAATGLSGIDYVVSVDRESYSFERWNGTEFEQAPGELEVGSIGNPALILTIAMPRQLIGGSASLDFFVTAVQDTGSDDVPQDDAPDTGVWTYEYTTPPKIASGTFVVAPKRPRAGAIFTVSQVTLVLTNGRRIAPANVKCTARLARKTLKPLGGMSFGRCAWIVPKNAKGKKLVVTVTASYGGNTRQLKPRAFTVR